MPDIESHQLLRVQNATKTAAVEVATGRRKSRIYQSDGTVSDSPPPLTTTTATCSFIIIILLLLTTTVRITAITIK